MNRKRLLCLCTIVLTSGLLCMHAYAQWVSEPGSSVIFDTETGEVIDDHYTPAEKKRLEKLDREALKRIEQEKRDGTYYRSRSSENNTSSGDDRPFGQISNGGGGALGTIDRDGTIRDTFGSMVGRVHDGTISNSRGLTEGMIDSLGRITKDGAVIGQLHGGEVSDISGHLIGGVDSNGTITDASGTRIGSVPAGDTEAGAVFLLHHDCKIHNRC